MKRALLFVAALGCCAGPARAQTTQTHVEMWRQAIDDIAALRAKAGTNLANDVGAKVSVPLNITAFYLFAHAQTLTRELRLIEDARTDKQLGAPPAAGGSTSAVSKGAVPAILAFAVEHGALTQTANDTNVTLRGNLVGWLDLLREQDFIEAYRDDSGLVRQLRRVSYSLTYDTTPATPAISAGRPSPEAIEEQAKEAGRQLSAYSVRYTFVDRRDPRRADNRAAVSKLVRGQGVALLEASAFLDPVLVSPEYDRWLDETTVALTAPGKMSRGEIERVLYKRLELLRQLMAERIPDFDTGVAKFVRALQSFEGARTGLFDVIRQRGIVAAELVRLRPAGLPSSSTYRVIAEGTFGRRGLDVTANAAVTVQDSGTALVPEPKATEGVSDMQFAVQAELPLGKEEPCPDKGSGLGKPVLAFEYLSRKLFEPAVVRFAGHDFSVTPGWIHVGQVKVILPVRGSGVKVPFSVSVANRSELLKEKKQVRAHIGLTVDMDVLAAAVRR